MTPAQRRAQWLVLAVVLFDMVGIGIAFPTLPILVGQYTADPSEQAAWYGFIMAAYAAMQFVCAPFVGALSDHFGRRPLLLITIAGLALHYFLIAVAPSIWVLLFARLLGGVTGASFSVVNAYLADITPPEDRAKSFGKVGAAFGLGFIVGPVLGGVLGHIDPHLPFYVGAACSALNLLFAYFFVHESLPPEKRAAFSLAKANPFGALHQLVRKHALGTFVVGFAVLSFAHMTMILSWVLFTQHRFGWGTWENGWLLATVGVLSAVVQGGLMGMLVKRFGEAKLAILSLCTAVVGNALYGFATEGWMMYAILIATAVGFTGGPAIQGIISKTTDPSVQGVTMGALTSIASLTGSIAPIVGNSILAHVVKYPPSDIRVGAVFFLCSALDVVALILIWSHIRRVTIPAPAKIGDFR